jgi:diguanylate cyclase (GGDEF)-like protein/PAS domain S-box-containing protein
MSDRSIERKLQRLASLRAEIKRLEEEIETAGMATVQSYRRDSSSSVNGVASVGEPIADEDLARLIVTNSHDLITVHSADGTYLWISGNCKEFLGTPREQLIGTNAYSLFHPDDLERIAGDHADTLQVASSRVTYRLRQGDGSYRCVETRSYLNQAPDESVRLVAITRDVHDRILEQEQARRVERRLNQRLMDLASTDSLTKLTNRMSGDATLRREFSRVSRSGSDLSIVLADIDHFKSINDRFGHPIGDDVLVGIAGVMRETVRDHDFVCRWGGEEFLLILPDTGLNDSVVLAKRMRTTIEQWENATGEQVTVSAGVTTVLKDDTVESMITRADAALYRAKNEGRNRVIVGR